MMSNELYQKLNNYIYYILIFLISLVVVLFIPFVGSTVGIGLNLPTTTAGWIVWGSTRGIVSILNVVLFDCFVKQAKINIREDEHYKKANEILGKISLSKEYKPKSPGQWLSKQYLSKGTTIFIGTALSVTALTQAVLTFDWLSMLTYLFAVFMGVIFGVLQMKKTEIYWTTEYYEYAIMKEKEIQDDNIRRKDASEPARAG